METIPLSLTPFTLPTQCAHSLLKAHAALATIYRHAVRTLHQEEVDPLQLAFHLNNIQSDAVPLLQVIENSTTELGDWLAKAATQFGHLFCALSSYQDRVKNLYIFLPESATLMIYPESKL